MSHGEGYELFTCPNCGSNLYMAGERCSTCDYIEDSSNDRPSERESIGQLGRTVVLAEVIGPVPRTEVRNIGPIGTQLHEILTRPEPNIDLWSRKAIAVLEHISNRRLNRTTRTRFEKPLRRLHALVPIHPSNQRARRESARIWQDLLTIARQQQLQPAPASVPSNQEHPHARTATPPPYYSDPPTKGQRKSLRTWLGRAFLFAVSGTPIAIRSVPKVYRSHGIPIAFAAHDASLSQATRRRAVDQRLTRFVEWHTDWLEVNPDLAIRDCTFAGMEFEFAFHASRSEAGLFYRPHR